jgi:3-dehydro-L-gulonate 2-dehydrogenase
MRIEFDKMKSVLYDLFIKYHFPEDKAELLAKTYTETTLDGVNSHGINRVPMFIEYIENGSVKIDEEAEKVGEFGNMERWDGHQGPGIINATICTNRAIELAKTHGMGLVALRNNNHWMRAGTYGRMAADAGCMAICFTNTQPNMPPWGGMESRTGNNPIVMAIPRKDGHVVMDMAVSQFAFGKINQYRLEGKKLPYPGGWDLEDNLSDDPEAILKKQRGLPVGYWKGSALSMMLDMLATMLSAGDSTFKIGKREYEYNVSQVFLCIDTEKFGDTELQQTLLKEIIDYTHNVEPMNPGDKIYYPGERTLETRAKNIKEGMPVSDEVWEEVLGFLLK